MERQPDTPFSGGTMPNDPASGATQQGSDSMAGQAKQTIADAAHQATAKASQQVESGVNRGKERTARAFDAVAESLQSVGNDLRGRNEDMIGRFVDNAADRARRIATRLNNADPNQLIDELESFARREPALFIGGAFAVGLIAARFLKSSRRGEMGDSMGSQPISRSVAPVPVPAERDVTDSLVHRETIPGPGPTGQPTF